MNRNRFRLVPAMAVLIFLVGVLPAQENLQSRIFQARDLVMPALVHVQPVISFYTTGERRHTLVTGSGFIFSAKGQVLTNYHVVQNAEKVTCTLSNKKKISATVIGSDPSTDIAVLQLDLHEWGDAPLPVARLGNSDSVEVGQIVLALGSPLGLSRSLSMGVISSIDRYFPDQGDMISPYNLWIQTDAAINPGNSGGPLINLDGRVVGINARGVFMAENLGFAIPVNLAREIANRLLEKKKIRRSWLGLELQPVSDLRDYLRRPDLRGVLISDVDILSPAQKAGIRAGDVLQSLNRMAVNADYQEDLPQIRKLIADLPVDSPATLRVWRDGRPLSIDVTPQPEPFRTSPKFECPAWGLVTEGLNRAMFRRHRLPDYDGVVVAAVKRGEAADRAGVRVGDVIRRVNHVAIRDMEQFQAVYRQELAAGETSVFMKLYRSGGAYFVVVAPDSSR